MGKCLKMKTYLFVVSQSLSRVQIFAALLGRDAYISKGHLHCKIVLGRGE